VLAGVVFAGVTMWFAHSTGGKADMPLAMMATIVQGDAAMAAGTANPTVGVLVHLALSALFGAVLALAVPRLRTSGTVAVAGTAYGLLLYVVNFLVLTPRLFTTFKGGQPAVRGLRPHGLRHPAVVRLLRFRRSAGRACPGH
jgi:hypothetical protein